MKTKKLIKCQDCQKTKWWKRWCWILSGLCVISNGIAINCLVHSFKPNPPNYLNTINQLELYNYDTNQIYSTINNHEAYHQINLINQNNSLCDYVCVLRNYEFYKTVSSFNNMNNIWTIQIKLTINGQTLLINHLLNDAIHINTNQANFKMDLQFYIQLNTAHKSYAIMKFTLLNLKITTD